MVTHRLHMCRLAQPRSFQTSTNLTTPVDTHLTVSEAADLLSVHVGTIRRWTDDGTLPEVRTPGGHRRIPASAVERLRRERADGGDADAVESVVPTTEDVALADQAWAEHVAVHARYGVRTQTEAPWSAAFEGGERIHRRETGRQLVGLLLRHVGDHGSADARGAELRRLAWGYALDLKDRGLPLSQALQATLFFRDILTESTAYYPHFGADEPRDPVFLVRKVNEFMNEVQMTIARAYESDADGVDADGADT
ncbi:MAG TPA: helix-turn-helix domain-containing protein [Bacteroidetes bacterium]|nr:helix-turn-helix domain-containing protein [Bacteroidota bacterium]HIL58235.1 helix-turn-helix domain-containing protein [Rhodothermales bacterium]